MACMGVRDVTEAGGWSASWSQPWVMGSHSSSDWWCGMCGGLFRSMSYYYQSSAWHCPTGERHDS